MLKSIGDKFLNCVSGAIVPAHGWSGPREHLWPREVPHIHQGRNSKFQIHFKVMHININILKCIKIN